MNVIVLALLGAILWRLRGGLLNGLTGKKNWMGFNDTVVREIWSFGMAGAFWLMHPHAHWLGSPWHLSTNLCGFFLMVVLFNTSTIGWFGAQLIPPAADWRDALKLSFDGLMRMAPVALLLLSPWPIVAGVLFGLAYWLGARLPQKPGSWDFWGEWFCGATIGACLAVS